MSNLRTATLVAALTVSVVLGGCEYNPTEPTQAKAPPPSPSPSLCEAGPYLIHLSGQCRVASSDRIVCEDETITTPVGKVLSITFQLRNAHTGTPVETRSVSSGVLPRETSFSGLVDGSYEVRHTVQARDCTSSFTTYASLEVF
ncbi:MAG TPA: hypothetical protein VJ885_02520 [Thermoanaerobaculia bacterium]|nr:hypothetical protein [Thermoanaerobaculia bacterium]